MVKEETVDYYSLIDHANPPLTHFAQLFKTLKGEKGNLWPCNESSVTSPCTLAPSQDSFCN